MVPDQTAAALPRGKDPEQESARELLNFQAQLCEQSCRFEDMVEVVQELCKSYTDLAMDERNLLSCAYKNVIGSRRTSWRILNETLQNATDQQRGGAKQLDQEEEEAKNVPQQTLQSSSSGKRETTTSTSGDDYDDDCGGNGHDHYNVPTIRSILKTIEDELRKHCCNIIDILTNQLIPSASATGESRVFYYKMKGDYIRYLCEISPEQEQKERSNESLLAYKTACDRAMIELPPTHPVRLGLMLNFSVFYYDIMKSPERSCRLAKQAFDDAIAELDTLSEESYRDSTIIMQLLRDNLNLWQSEQKLQLTNE